MIESTWTNEFGQHIYRASAPIEKPKASLVIVHGLGEHIRRYDHLFSFYNQHGFSVYGFDSIGFGQSDGKRGVVRSQQQLQNEINMLINWAREENDVPVVLYGHSLGGQKVLDYCLQSENLPDACVATSPFIDESTKTPKLKLTVGRLLSQVIPSFSISNELNVSSISRVPEVVEAYKNDKLNTAQISLRLGDLSFKTAERLRGEGLTFPIPLLLTHGSADLLTSFEATKVFAEKLNGNVSFQPWEGGYHELHNDIIADEFNQTVLQWITEKL